MSESSPRAILHPTDFSDASRPALGLACDLALDHAADLLIVHVADPGTGRGDPAVPLQSLEELRQRVDEKAARLRSDHPALKVRSKVVEGLPTDAILAAAVESSCDLIVMGSHGRTGVGRVLVGSVAERVARRAPCPVLILKAPRDSGEGAQAPPVGGDSGRTGPRFPVVLVPTDFSKRSREALQVAQWLLHEGSLLVVAHVIEEMHVAAEGLVEALTERLREWAEPIAGSRTEYLLREGDTADEILALARETHASLIIEASHGRTGLDRLMMGSVAEKVFRGAPCPVLIVRLPDRTDS